MNRLLAALLAAVPLVASAEAPLTLDDALALASRQSRDLAIAKADLDLAAADTTGAWQGLLPRLDLMSTAGRKFYGASRSLLTVPVGFDAATNTPVYQQTVVTQSSQSLEDYSLGLQLSVPLVDVSAWNLMGRARAAARAATRTYDESRLSVAFDVIRRFYELVKAERTLEVLEKAVGRSEELVSRSDALFSAGRAQKLDTFTARGNLGNDRIAAEQARTRLVQARADLAVALGRPGDAPVQAVAPAEVEGPGLPSGEPPPLEVLVARAAERRPSVAAATAQVEAADAGLWAARGSWWPTLSAQATYNRGGPQVSGSDGVLGDPTRQYYATAQLVLAWNLFAGRATEANVARAQAGADRARANAGKTLDAVARELASARQTLVGLARQVALSADNLGSAEQGLALARQRLEAGLASQLEVRDATLKLTQAELSLVQARIDHAVAAADLNRAVGGAL